LGILHLKKTFLAVHLKHSSFYPLVDAWTNFNLQDEPWAEFSTLEVATSIPRTYCLVLQYNLT